ncbi:MAG: hypothetical protein GY861_21905 [bacterium]|nr:hypothetical protein [bacterium]
MSFRYPNEILYKHYENVEELVKAVLNLDSDFSLYCFKNSRSLFVFLSDYLTGSSISSFCKISLVDLDTISCDKINCSTHSIYAYKDMIEGGVVVYELHRSGISSSFVFRRFPAIGSEVIMSPFSWEGSTYTSIENALRLGYNVQAFSDNFEHKKFLKSMLDKGC